MKGLYLENFAQNLPDINQIDPDAIQTLCRYVEEDSVQVAIERIQSLSSVRRSLIA